MATKTTDWLYPNSASSIAVELSEFRDDDPRGTTNEPWYYSSRILANDGESAEVYLNAAFPLPPISTPSNWIVGNYNSLNLPVSATNFKIEVDVSRRASSTNSVYSGCGLYNDHYGDLFLYNGNSKLGFLDVSTPKLFTTSLVVENYGGSSDPLNSSLSLSLLNSGNFQIRYWCQNFNIIGSRTAYIDFIRMRLTYDYTGSSLYPKIIGPF